MNKAAGGFLAGADGFDCLDAWTNDLLVDLIEVKRLMLCDYAVADLTTANPNVLYDLAGQFYRFSFRTASTQNRGTSCDSS